MTIRTTLATVCLAAILCMATAACGSDITTGARVAEGSVRFEMQGLQGRASVVDSVILTVQPSAGGVQRQAVQLDGDQSEVSFGIRVPPGSTRFGAEVLSNTGSLLFAGETTASIEADGFQVVVPVTARAPVMVVTPDTALMSWDGSYYGGLSLHNAGIQSFRWEVDTSQLPFPRCQRSGPTPCIDLFFERSVVDTSSVAVSIYIGTSAPNDLPAQGVTLRLSSFSLVAPTRIGYADVQLVPNDERDDEPSYRP